MYIDKDRKHRLHEEIINTDSGVEIVIIALLETLMIPTNETIGKTVILMIFFGNQQNRDRPSVDQSNYVTSDFASLTQQ